MKQVGVEETEVNFIVKNVFTGTADELIN